MFELKSDPAFEFTNQKIVLVVHEGERHGRGLFSALRFSGEDGLFDA